MNVCELVSAYLDNIALRTQAGLYSEAQAKLVAYLLSDFCRAFGQQDSGACAQTDLTRWLLSHPKWKADATKASAINAVTICFRWAVEERLIPYCPYRKPKGLALKLRPRQPLESGEYSALMRAMRGSRAGSRLRCALYFLRRTAARTCEMRCLLRQDIDWSKSVAYPYHHKAENSGESRSIGMDGRVLRLLRWLCRRPINPALCRCEEAKRREHVVGDHLFLNSQGRPWTKDSFAKLFRGFARKLGVKKTGYCLRHAFCVAAIVSGETDRAIADQMGWTNTRMVSWYGRHSRARTDHLCWVVGRVLSALE